MFIDYFHFLLAAAKKTLDHEGIPASVSGTILAHYTSGVPLVEPTPEKDHPARLRIGSSLAIHLSRDLKKNGVELVAERLAQGIFTETRSCPEPDFHVDVGNEVFLNGHPSESCFERSIQHRILNPPEDFYFSQYVLDDEKHIKKTLQLHRELINKKEASADQLKRIFSLDISRAEKLILLYSLLSDDEFDIEAVTASVVFSNNPLSVLSLCRSILYDRPESFQPRISRNLYAKPVYFLMLDKVCAEAEEFIAKFRFLELQSALRKRPEILWKEMFKVLLSFRSLWNDPWGRIALGGMAETSDHDTIVYLQNMMKWIVQSWDAYSSVLELVPFEEIVYE
jgi:hypothetical protein